MVFAPVLVLGGPRSRARGGPGAVLEAPVGDHRVYAQRWLDRPDAAADELLGSPDPSSLADAAAVYETARGMRVVPISQNDLVAVAVAAALPMVPLVALEVPIKDIAQRLIGILA
jgi:hypothetical protein